MHCSEDNNTHLNEAIVWNYLCVIKGVGIQQRKFAICLFSDPETRRRREPTPFSGTRSRGWKL